MINDRPHRELSLEDVLHKINESVDDFASNPAKSASDKGAFDDYPLHKVAIWGDIEAASILLKNGAEINAIGEDGDTPLLRAIAGNKLEMIEFLLCHGADVNLKNRYGLSAIDSANNSNISDSFNMLLRKINRS